MSKTPPKTLDEKITFYQELAVRQAAELTLMNEQAAGLASRLVPLLGEYQAIEAQRAAALTSLGGLRQIVEDLEAVRPEAPASVSDPDGGKTQEP